jgi:hypothetical protein
LPSSSPFGFLRGAALPLTPPCAPFDAGFSAYVGQPTAEELPAVGRITDELIAKGCAEPVALNESVITRARKKFSLWERGSLKSKLLQGSFCNRFVLLNDFLGKTPVA